MSVAEPRTDLDPEIWDENGFLRNPPYLNGLNSTTSFHPGELPADPQVRAAFPKELIADASDENWTTGPADTVPAAQRQAASDQAMKAAEAAVAPDVALAPEETTEAPVEPVVEEKPEPIEHDADKQEPPPGG